MRCKLSHFLLVALLALVCHCFPRLLPVDNGMMLARKKM